MLRLPAPAKLNLCLNIVGQRQDGYHELQTAFQLIDWCDWLTLTPADTLTVTCPGIDVPPEKNLVHRAAVALAQHAGVAAAASINVEKHIPEGGGLGGGSSDAATALWGLARLWQLDVGADELAEIGLGLGADVPFFVHGRSAWAEGIGEILQPIDLPEKWFVVVHPGVSVPTAEIFSHPDLTRHGHTITIARFLRQGARNACEPVVRKLFPAVDEAVRWLGNFGPAKMSGTGACLYVPVDTESDARAIVEKVPARWTGFVARGISLSPLLEAVSQ